MGYLIVQTVQFCSNTITSSLSSYSLSYIFSMPSWLQTHLLKPRPIALLLITGTDNPLEWDTRKDMMGIKGFSYSVTKCRFCAPYFYGAGN